jgi:hypothetical protein
MYDYCESTNRRYWTPAPHDQVKIFREERRLTLDGSAVRVTL